MPRSPADLIETIMDEPAMGEPGERYEAFGLTRLSDGCCSYMAAPACPGST